MRIKRSRFSTLFFHGIIALTLFQGCHRRYLTPYDTIQVSEQPILAIQYSPDGSQLVTIDKQANVALLDSSTRKVTRQYVLPITQVENQNLNKKNLRILFSEDGKHLRICGHFITDSVTGNVKDEILSWSLDAASFSPVEFRRIIQGCDENWLTRNQVVQYTSPFTEVFVRNVDTNQETLRISLNSLTDNGLSFALLKGSHYLYVGFNQKNDLRRNELWDITSRQKILDNFDQALWQVSPKDDYLLMSKANTIPFTEISLWNIRDQRMSQIFHVPKELFGTNAFVQFSDDESRVMVSGKLWEDSRDYYIIWNINSSEPLVKNSGNRMDPDFFTARFLPGRTDRVLIGNQRSIADFLLNASTGDPVASFATFLVKDSPSEGLLFAIPLLSISPSGDQLAGLSNFSGEIQFWDLTGL